MLCECVQCETTLISYTESTETTVARKLLNQQLI